MYIAAELRRVGLESPIVLFLSAEGSRFWPFQKPISWKYLPYNIYIYNIDLYIYIYMHISTYTCIYRYIYKVYRFSFFLRAKFQGDIPPKSGFMVQYLQ